MITPDPCDCKRCQRERDLTRAMQNFKAVLWREIEPAMQRSCDGIKAFFDADLPSQLYVLVVVVGGLVATGAAVSWFVSL